jgi:protein-S-isoprenylcysteine O-methyltransferase Ste14
MRTIDVLALVSLVSFYALFLGRTLLLRRKGVKVWVLGASARKGLGMLLEYAMFPVLALWPVYALLLIFRVELPHILAAALIDAPQLKYAGVALCYIGLAVFLAALLSFGKAWRIGIDEKNAEELITGGVFKYSRNPIFLFMDMHFMGMMLIYPTILTVLTAIGALIGLHLQILREEAFLLRKFGAAYAAYKRRTRRYF